MVNRRMLGDVMIDLTLELDHDREVIELFKKLSGTDSLPPR
jgi:hypothetical protein